MKMKKMIIEHFTFLLDNGFILECDSYFNIIHTYSFNNANDCKIIISIDLREKFVDLKIKKATKILLEIAYNKVMKNHEFNGLEEMLKSLKNIYDEAEKEKCGFSKRYINLIFMLYAKFILMDFSQLM